MNDRPKHLTEEMARCAAEKVVRDLIRDGHIEEKEASESAVDIARHGNLWGDGYQLARDLENNCYWDCNMAMAEILDTFSSHARDQLEAAEKAWAVEHKPEPKFETGARVRLKSGGTGVVDGVYEYGPAKYLVKMDGDADARPPANSRRIVNFEDAMQCGSRS
jgi:hypothetical protein